MKQQRARMRAGEFYSESWCWSSGNRVRGASPRLYRSERQEESARRTGRIGSTSILPAAGTPALQERVGDRLRLKRCQRLIDAGLERLASVDQGLGQGDGFES